MITLLVIALILFTLLSGFFSGSETAFFSLSPMKVRAYGHHRQPRQRLVARLLSRPRDLLVTILMMNVLVNILVQNIASSLFEGVAGWSLQVGLPLVLTLFFGEIIPKTIAYANNTRIAPKVAPLLYFLQRTLGPLRLFITKISSYISRTFFFFLRRDPQISDEELRHALQTSEEGGVLTAEESQLIGGYLSFQDAIVKELMRPREEVISFDLSQPIEELANLFQEKMVTRVPVCEGDLEQVIGIAEASRFFVDRPHITDLQSHLRKPFFAPETMGAKALLLKLEERNEDMALVVDEYGSIAGLVTREDLIEVVVGEIADRRDVAARYTRASPDVIIASGKLELNELNALFDTNLASEGNLVTVGGWLTERLGELPRAGTRYVTDELLFHVLATDPNRVRRIYIRRIAPERS